MELNPLTNNLQYSEKNLDYVNKIICDYNLKDNMIGWLVNKSAIKVGTSNLNPKASWFDNTPLLYTTMSTRFGGDECRSWTWWSRSYRNDPDD
jgi:hypothetical protein